MNLRPRFVWLGGGHINTKLGVSLTDLIGAVSSKGCGGVLVGDIIEHDNSSSGKESRAEDEAF